MAISNSTDRFNGALAALAIKVPCVAVTNAAITLSGEQTIDGVAVVSIDRVLVKDQADPIENGIYIVSSSSWDRAPDWDGNRDVTKRTIVICGRSGVQSNVMYQQDTGGTIRVGTDPTTFSVFFDPDAGTQTLQDVTTLGNTTTDGIVFVSPDTIDTLTISLDNTDANIVGVNMQDLNINGFTGRIVTDRNIESPQFQARAITPALELYENNAGVDAKEWNVLVGSEIFYISTADDVNVFGESVLRATRTGTAVNLVELHGDNIILMPDVDVKLETQMFMLEQAAALADQLTYGQFWVRNDAPNVPMFTDDLGNDFVLNSGGSGGSALTDKWTFNNSIAVADPGTNQFSFNATLLTTATLMLINDAALGGFNFDDMAQWVTAGRKIKIYDPVDPTVIAWFRVGQNQPDQTGWWRIDIDHIKGSTALVNGTDYVIEFELEAFINPGLGTTSGNTRNLLYWDGGQWQATDQIQINPDTPPIGGRISAPTSSSSDVRRSMILMKGNTDSAIWSSEYTAANVGFYCKINVSPRETVWGYWTAGTVTGTDIFGIDNSLRMTIESAAQFRFAEKAAAGANAAGFGEIWVRNDVSNVLVFTDDVGGDTDISQPSVLWNTGNQIVQALPDGISVAGDSANTAASGSLQNTRILFENNAADPVAEFGFNSVALLALESHVYSGGIEIRGKNSAGVVQEAMVFDPDAVLSLRGVTDLELLTNEIQTALLATDSLDVALFYNNVEKFRTSLETAAGMISGAEVVNPSGVMKPVGLGVIEDDGTVFGSGAQTPFQQINAGESIKHTNASAATYSTYASTGANQTNIPAGAQWEVKNDGGGALTIGAGTSVTLYWWDGGGVTPPTGNRTLARGGFCTVKKISDTRYEIVGNGLS